MLYSVFFMLAVFGGLGFFYFRMYQKGKAAGGGMMEGFAQAERERWQGALEGDEQIQIRGSGIEMMPWWKSLLRENFPITRSFIKVMTHEFIVTSRGRILKMTTSMGQIMSSTGPVEVLSLEDIVVNRMQQEKVSALTQMTSKAMGGGEVRVFTLSMKLKSAEKDLELSNVNGDFADYVSTRLSAAPAAA
ncbi:MAG: hypothetical protein U0169_10635 [Polyangiaceae bacterium]